MFQQNLFIIVFVCFISTCFSYQSPILTSLEIAPGQSFTDLSLACQSASNNISSNGTVQIESKAFLDYLQACVNSAFPYANTSGSVTCENTTNSAVSNYKTLCASTISFQVGSNASDISSDTAKLCTVTINGKPNGYNNVTWAFTTYLCVPQECASNSTDLNTLAALLGEDIMFSGHHWNLSSGAATATVKCGGIALWVIILIIVIIVVVVVLVIVGVVVMMRRKNQYQNL